MRALRLAALVLSLMAAMPAATFAAGGTGGNDGTSSYVPPPPPNDTNWEPYGFAAGEDPDYRFVYPDNSKTDILGLAAKGNIVLGDYTQPEFQNYVAPKLKPGKWSVTQPYMIDPTDASLGYSSYVLNGKQYFNGDYTQVDEQGNGKKLDGSPRRFYESTLPDWQYSGLVESWMNNPNHGEGSGNIQAVLYTNHAIAGLVKAYDLGIFGAIVARDDAFMYGKRLWLDHDIRIMEEGSQIDLNLPVSIKRPRLVSLTDCGASGCPSSQK